MAFTSTGSLARDFYCDTIDEAFEEIRRRKSSPGAGGTITRFEESRYGGYRVYTVDAELFVDQLVDPIQPRVPSSSFATRRTVYR